MTIGYHSSQAADTVRLITLDPGHFHAGLVQKFMYPQVSPNVHVYAPPGLDVQEHLKRIEGFNTRAENPTHWREEVYTGADFVERMLSEKAGTVVVISGNNAHKTEYIEQSIAAGFNVLADKPMVIAPKDFAQLREAFKLASKNKVLLYDIMTERYEINNLLQRALARMPEIFGTMAQGTPDAPAAVMESVHYYLKEVAAKPLIRPAWFFDVRQEGEAIPDVGTHLVDLIQWACFPQQALDWKRDVRLSSARRWATKITLEEFKRVTGLANYPGYLQRDVDKSGALNVFQNGEVSYRLRGVQAKVTALWKFEAPPGGKDMFYSVLRGSRAMLEIKQGPEQGYQPTLYVESTTGESAGAFEGRLRAAVGRLCDTWPGLELKTAGHRWQIVVPEKYNVGHEAHFAQVTENYLRYLTDGQMPDWEVPSLLTKYYTTTEAYRLSHAGK
jgi:predicted dehydrogenase